MLMRCLNGLEKSTLLWGVDLSPECGPWWCFLDKRAHTLWVGLQRRVQGTETHGKRAYYSMFEYRPFNSISLDL
jgi:hypothetical protein